MKTTKKHFSEMTVSELNLFISGCHRSGDHDGQFHAAVMERNSRPEFARIAMVGPDEMADNCSSYHHN